MAAQQVEHPTVTVSSFEDAKDVYRRKELRQALYDDGAVVMDGVLVNLHGDEHRQRRRVENPIFRRDTVEHYERDLFPGVIEQTMVPYLAVGEVDLVHLGHELMLNLAALTAGVDLLEGTSEQTTRLYDYMQWFIKGATLSHSTVDKAALSDRIRRALEEWDEEFLAPSIARRRQALDQLAAGELTESELPRDVLTALLRNADEMPLEHHQVRREIAFYLLASAHTSATAFVRSVDHILDWVGTDPVRAARINDDPIFVQRCVHETVRLNPSSPTGMRWALEPVTLKSGIEIPQGARVTIDLHAVNRDPEVFGENAGDFDPERTIPAGVGPFGLSFAAGMHVCIGQDLAAGVVPRAQADPADHLFGLVPGAVQYLFRHGVRRDPERPPQRDAETERPYWGIYPALLDRTAAERRLGK
jgi:cytochrome P450